MCQVSQQWHQASSIRSAPSPWSSTIGSNLPSHHRIKRPRRVVKTQQSGNAPPHDHPPHPISTFLMNDEAQTDLVNLNEDLYSYHVHVHLEHLLLASVQCTSNSHPQEVPLVLPSQDSSVTTSNSSNPHNPPSCRLRP